jgi:hypothetical protein
MIVAENRLQDLPFITQHGSQQGIRSVHRSFDGLPHERFLTVRFRLSEFENGPQEIQNLSLAHLIKYRPDSRR